MACVNLPERTQINMPQLTYSRLRSEFFQHAKSRLDFYDFRHFAKLLHARLEEIRGAKPTEEGKENETGKMVRMCKMFVQDVNDLIKQPILLKG